MSLTHLLQDPLLPAAMHEQFGFDPKAPRSVKMAELSCTDVVALVDATNKVRKVSGRRYFGALTADELVSRLHEYVETHALASCLRKKDNAV